MFLFDPRRSGPVSWPRPSSRATPVPYTSDGRSSGSVTWKKTQARLEDIQRGIDGLRLKRKDVETTVKATIQSLRNTLEFVREQEAREREDKILFHRPRHAEPLDSADAHPSRKAVG